MRSLNVPSRDSDPDSESGAESKKPRRRRHKGLPSNLLFQVGYFAFDRSAPLGVSTFLSALGSAFTALKAADYLIFSSSALGSASTATSSSSSAPSGVAPGHRPFAYALCRPPGHHAGASIYGGFCFLNNAALAVDKLNRFTASGQSNSRVAFLDLDFHHGNGSQDIFYDRDSVFFVSIHADPNTEFPYFSGYDDELGVGKGAGFNKNFPLPLGTQIDPYLQALDLALDSLVAFDPHFLVISMGFDSCIYDLVGGFSLYPSDYTRIAARIASRIKAPTLVVQEGGYDVRTLGECAINFLSPFAEIPEN